MHFANVQDYVPLFLLIIDKAPHSTLMIKDIKTIKCISNITNEESFEQTSFFSYIFTTNGFTISYLHQGLHPYLVISHII